jgi:excinuclease UvrABC nuclease subunit
MRRHVRKLPCDVYRIFDAEGHLLYVGMSANVFRRMEQHKADYQPWIPLAASFEVTRYRNRRSAAYMEALIINEESPAWNVRNESKSLNKYESADLTPIEAAEVFPFPRSAA